MYQKKSEILEKLRDYHQRLGLLLARLKAETEQAELKNLLLQLIAEEEDRSDYLKKHIEVARTQNEWLQFECQKMDGQMEECLKIEDCIGELTIEQVLNLERHFDQCLIRIYENLCREAGTSGDLCNIFHYMTKRTQKQMRAHDNILV